MAIFDGALYYVGRVRYRGRAATPNDNHLAIKAKPPANRWRILVLIERSLYSARNGSGEIG